MRAKLKKVCPKCTQNSIDVYFRNIKRLHRLISDDDVPETAAWLGKDELMKKYKKLDLSKRRHLSVSAVKASQAYDSKKHLEKWTTMMYKDSSEYNSKRAENKRTPEEMDKWPKKGYPALKNASTEYKRRIRNIFQQEPSMKNLYSYSKYIIIRFYSTVAMRNDLASIMVKKYGEGNYLSRAKGVYTIHMKIFKTAKHFGDTEIKLDKNLSKVIFDYVKYRDAVGIKHKFLLSNQKGGPLTRSALGKILTKLTSDLLNKKIGSRIIRVLKATSMRKQIEAVADLSKEMLHSGKQTKQYTRKE